MSVENVEHEAGRFHVRACRGSTFQLLGRLFGSFFHVSQSCPGHVRRGLGRRTQEENGGRGGGGGAGLCGVLYWLRW